MPRALSSLLIYHDIPLLAHTGVGRCTSGYSASKKALLWASSAPPATSSPNPPTVSLGHRHRFGAHLLAGLDRDPGLDGPGDGYS